MMEINNKNFIVFEDQNVFSKEYKEMKKNLPTLLFTIAVPKNPGCQIGIGNQWEILFDEHELFYFVYVFPLKPGEI